MKIKHAKDFWSGMMFAAFGLGFAVIAQNYDMGTAARMGPAYFPTVLGGLLTLLGVIIALRGLKTEEPDSQVDKFHFTPLMLILGAVVAFGLLLRPAGLLVALTVLVIVASFGSHEFKWREIIPLTVVLTLLVLGVFIYGLSMTIPVLPAFMRD
jgi:hypothetical protein